jgi:type II secretion system protein N
MKIILILILLPILIVFLIFGAWFIAVPEDMVAGYISSAVKSDKIKIKTEGIEKGFFLSLNIQKIELKRADETPLIAFDNLHIKPDFTSFVKLKPQLPFTGHIHSGFLEGVYDIRREAVMLNAGDIKLQDLSALKLVNIEGDGKLSVKMEIIQGEGNILLNVKDASLKTTFLQGGYVLPLNWFNDIKGLLAVKKNILEVKSFTLEGEGVYARIKGSVTGDASDLTMEVMPDESFKNSSLLMLISPFQASPGYYVIPIKLKELPGKVY